MLSHTDSDTACVRSYVLWLLAHTLLWLEAMLLIELLAPPLPAALTNHESERGSSVSLLDCVSFHMLEFFLGDNRRDMYYQPYTAMTAMDSVLARVD
jgi:hypothetical protein